MPFKSSLLVVFNIFMITEYILAHFGGLDFNDSLVVQLFAVLFWSAPLLHYPEA